MQSYKLGDNLSIILSGEAVQYVEACLTGLTELCLEPGEQHKKMLAAAVTGTYKGVKLTNHSADNTLDPERKRITG